MPLHYHIINSLCKTFDIRVVVKGVDVKGCFFISTLYNFVHSEAEDLLLET